MRPACPHTSSFIDLELLPIKNRDITTLHVRAKNELSETNLNHLKHDTD
jgi:hypothetical protein